MIEDYITGINWSFNYYYNSMKSINKRWYYKFLEAPLFIDIYNYLNTKAITDKWKDTITDTLPNVLSASYYNIEEVERCCSN